MHATATALDDAARALVESNLPLAHALGRSCRRRYAPDVPADELVAEALYALTFAATRFDDARGVPFGPFAVMVIRQRLAAFVRSWRRYGRPASLSAAGPREADRELEAPESASGAAAAAEARDTCEWVRQLLPARRWDMLYAHHAEGLTMQEVGERFGCARQWVREAEGNTLRKLRKLLAADTEVGP